MAGMIVGREISVDGIEPPAWEEGAGDCTGAAATRTAASQDDCALLKLRVHLGDAFPLVKVRERCGLKAVVIRSLHRIRRPETSRVFLASLDGAKG
jgi:hypothetical protein